MPQRNYSKGELVYIYDAAHFQFGTVYNYRSERDENRVRHETYGIITVGKESLVVCTPDQLRCACWTFVGPVVVPGDDVIEGFGMHVKKAERVSPSEVHWFSDSRYSLHRWGRMIRNIAGVK